MLVLVSKNQALSMKCVARFREDRESVSHNLRSERPVTSVSNENIDWRFRVEGSSPDPPKTHRTEQLRQIKLIGAQGSPSGVGWKLRHECQLRYHIHDHGSKLRGPSPIALVLLKSSA
ncbi:hypothetical protein TNCV_939881 [Trichonephila clavipes]|nr:hypothetical protein TNCV_939881 [Trichonephila clavipes]